MASNYGRLSAVTIAVAALCVLASGVLAQPAPGKEITHVVVLPVVDRTVTHAVTPAVLEKATAAVALALEDSGQFTVASTSDLRREIDSLSVRPPFNQDTKLRLAEKLHADRVITGYLEGIQIDSSTGSGTARIEIESLDVAAEAVTGGGVGEGQIKPVPGWVGDSDAIINQVLRDAAEDAVGQMQVHRVRRGFVESIDDQGLIHLNLGVADGLRVGDELVIMRGIWERELEKTELHKIGVMRITQIDADRSGGTSVSGMPPRTGDRAYVLYQPATAMAAIERGHKITRASRVLAAIALGVGIVAVAMGGNPSGVQGNLSAPGGECEPTSTVQTSGLLGAVQVDVFQNGNVPDPSQVHGYIIYRGTSQFLDVSNADNIVEVMDQSYPGSWTDDQTDTADIEFNKSWSYVNGSGSSSSTTASADIVYNHHALIPGNTYYYRVRRIVSPYVVQLPISNSGSGSGTTTASVHPAQVTFATTSQTYTPDETSVLSEPSGPLGPVTVIDPVVPVEPLNGSTTINPQQITFSWNLGTPPSVGNASSARYVLVVYNASNLNTPIYESTPQVPTSTTMTVNVQDPNGTIFTGGTSYVWEVGHYVQGEARAKNTLGLVMSRQFTFTTVNMPPSAAAAGAATGGSQRTGWWGEQRLRRP